MNLREPRYDCDHDRLAEHVARLEQQLFAARERIGIMEEDNARLQAENQQLRDENERLKQQLATARKDSSTSSKPPSIDIVKPKKPPARAARSGRRAGSRDTSSPCGRRSCPRRSIISSAHARLLSGLRRQTGSFAVRAASAPASGNHRDSDPRHRTPGACLLVPALPERRLRSVAQGGRQGGAVRLAESQSRSQVSRQAGSR